MSPSRSRALFISVVLAVAAGAGGEAGGSLPTRPESLAEKLENAGRRAEERAEALERRDENITALAEYANAFAAAWSAVAEVEAGDGDDETIRLAWARVAWLLEKAHALARATGDDTACLDALAALPEDVRARAPAELRGRAAWLEARLHLRHGRAGAARAAVAELDFPPVWALAGPFGLEQQGGLDARLGPETKPPAPADVFPGAFGEVGWRTIRVVDPAGVLRLSPRLRPRRQAAAYAVALARLDGGGGDGDVPRDALLRLGVDGPFILWHNGRRLAGIRRPAATGDPDQFVFPLRLAAGVNVLTVKTAPAESVDSARGFPAWSLALRLTDPDGAPLTGLEWAELSPDLTLPGMAAGTVDETAGEAREDAADAVDTVDAEGLPAAVARRGADDPVRVLWRYARGHAGDHRRAYYLGSLLTLRGWSPPTDGLEAREHWLGLAWAGLTSSPNYRLALARAFADVAGAAPPDDLALRERALNRCRALYETLVPTRSAAPPVGAADGGGGDSADAAGPAAIVAHIALSQLALDAWGQPERALRHAEEALAGNPSSARARLLLCRALAALDANAEADRELADLGRRFPDEPAVALAVGRAALAGGRPEAARRAFAAAHGRSGDARAWAGWQAALYHLGRDDEADALTGARLADFPLDEIARREKVRWAERRAEPDAWLAAVDEALTLAPQDPEWLTARGDALLALGRDKEADLAWEKAAKTLPAAPEVLARRDAFGHRPAPAVKRIADLAAWVRAQPAPSAAVAGGLLDAGYEILLYEIAREIAGEWRRTTWHVVARVLSPGGAARLARGEVSFGGGTAGRVRLLRVLGVDGEERRVPGRAAWTEGNPAHFLPALTPGEVVEWEVEIERRLPAEFAGHIGERFVFPQDAPARRVRFTLVVPDAPPLRVHALAGAPEPAVEEDAAGGRDAYRWEMRNLPARGRAGGAPAPEVQAGTFPDWNAFALWYGRLLEPRHRAVPEIRELARRLAEGKSDPVERLEAAHDWVARHFQPVPWHSDRHGFVPQDPVTILARRFADCKDRALLLCLLAREYGFDAAPALVRGVDTDGGGYGDAAGAEALFIPSIGHFNHCVVRVRVDGRPCVLDPTAPHRIAGEVPVAIAGATALAITPEGADWVRLADAGPAANRWREESTVALAGDGALNWTQIAEGAGLAAAHLRARLERPADHAAFLRAWTGALGSLYDDAVSAAPVIRPDRAPDGRGGHLEFIERGADGAAYTLLATSGPRAERAVGDDGADTVDPFASRRRQSKTAATAAGIPSARGALLMPLPPLLLRGVAGVDAPLPRRWSELAPAAEREGDLVLPFGLSMDRSVRFTWPAGWRAAPPPADIRRVEPFGELRAGFTVAGDSLMVRYTLVLTSHRIAAVDYPAFRTFCVLADRLDDWALLLEPEP